MDKLLQIDDISLEYKDFRLDNVSFSCEPGDIIGLIGINGAGKSTTINAILNIVEPDLGLVTWKGKEIYQNLERKSVLLAKTSAIIRPSL